VLFTTQTLGLNLKLENSEVIERLNDRFDILQNKNDVTHFFYGAGCGTDKMKINLSHAFQEFQECYYFCGRGYLCSGVQPIQKERKLLYLF
jgi:hypothetical protein